MKNGLYRVEYYMMAPSGKILCTSRFEVWIYMDGVWYWATDDRGSLYISSVPDYVHILHIEEVEE